MIAGHPTEIRTEHILNIFWVLTTTTVCSVMICPLHQSLKKKTGIILRAIPHSLGVKWEGHDVDH
jgi:predicted secreted protein